MSLAWGTRLCTGPAWPAHRRCDREVAQYTIRLFLHVLPATIWVGGQVTLAALVPVLRRAGTDIPRATVRRFSQVASAECGRRRPSGSGPAGPAPA